jgi:hypothetical protein
MGPILTVICIPDILIMKAIITLFVCVFALVCSAQPTIGSDTFIQVGDVFQYGQASLLSVESDEIQVEGGADLTWSFDEVEALGTPFTESYFPLDSTPVLFSLFFGNPIVAGENFSTHALSINVLDFEVPLPIELENAYQFYRSDEEGYFITGNGAEFEGVPLISAYDTLDRVYSFPLNYLDTDTNSFYFFTEVPGIGSVGQSGVRINEADAWGTVTTPYGTYECLRVRTLLNVTDTLFLEFTQDGGTFVRPEQTIYTWISPEIGGILAEASFIGDTLTAFRYLFAESALSTNAAKGHALSMYPNPAKDQLILEAFSGRNVKVILTDLTGRKALTTTFRDRVEIDLSMLPEGLYLVTVESGSYREIKRLVINR